MATIEPRGRIVPVLLSGGAGSRLWPLSRETYPKQLLSLLGENTLLQQTALRVDDRLLFTEPLVLANAEHRFAIGEQLRAVGVADPTIVLEPCGRNTAPAVAVAALLASERDPDALILVMPVDHWVRDRAAFRTAISAGIKGARYGRFVLFGVRPSGPETGFGYIRMGSELEAASPIRNVAGFVEKPDLVVVERLLACDEHLWNSGIFLLPARRFIDELAHREPDVLAACRNALVGATRDLDFLRLDAQAFEACPSISIDYAIMEKTDNAVVVPATFDWSDVGSWSALWSMADKDPSGNVVIGDALMEDASGCYVRGDDGQLVAALGVEDLIIAASPDVVLVTSRKRDQDVGRLVERLKANGHRSATQTRSVHRPWGYYQSIHAGERFQVKRITVNPGAKLSLQKHYHRAEHWVVVNGTAIVTRDDEEILLRENESIFVPLGCTHRLENPGKVPLNLIEIQSGSYLGEDDIVRMQDIYDRV